VNKIIQSIENRAKLAREYLIDACSEYIYPENPLREASLHYINSGGKGFRPAMLMLSAGAVGGTEDVSLPAAAAIEALHVSSLIHDDWMDHDEVRRGQPTVWKKWNPTVAILAGDALVGLAMRLIGNIKDLDNEVKFSLTTELAEKYVELCHGQMLDIAYTEQDPLTLTVEDIKKMQYYKTGVLFEFCCIAGARIGLNTIDHAYIEKVKEYAKLSGTAFQIQDDILGLIGDADKLGKPVDTDIREGKRTLIAIHAIENATDEQKQTILKGFGKENATEQDILNVLQVFQELGSIDNAKDIAKDLANKALDVLKSLPDSEQKEIMAGFTEYMIERKL
jgi:geranylgeranyl diphosphate synthase, type I